MLSLPPPFVVLLLRRGAWFWLGGRALVGIGMAFAAGLAGGRTPPPPVRFGAMGSLWFVVLCAALIVLDATRRRERILFANHGASLVEVAAVGAAPAAMAELAVRVFVPA